MRTLTRPMFRMGGPIKEGIMHGIREPYAGGGRAALVGNPVYPKTGGREHHALVQTAKAIATNPGMISKGLTKAKGAFQGLRPWWDKIKPTGKFRQTPGTGGISPAFMKGDYTQAGQYIPGAKKTAFEIAKSPSLMLKGIKENPYWTGVGGTLGVTSGILPLTAMGVGKTLKNVGLQAADLAVWDKIFDQDKYFADKAARDALLKKNLENNVVKTKTGTKPGEGRKEGMYYEDPAKKSRLAKEAKEKRINDLLETMGYDKAKKNAAYDALIDASKIITDRGNLRGDVTGEVINPIIQATSKRLDKPEQIREAVGLMQTKADIQKEMNKDENALANRVKELQILTGQKALEGPTLKEAANEYFTKQGRFPTGSSLANLARTKDIEIESVVDTKTVDTFLKNNKGKDVTDFIESSVQALKDAGTPIPEGFHVVKDRIFLIDINGNISLKY